MAVGSKKNLPPREDFLNTCQIKLPKEISYIKILEKAFQVIIQSLWGDVNKRLCKNIKIVIINKY